MKYSFFAVLFLSLSLHAEQRLMQIDTMTAFQSTDCFTMISNLGDVNGDGYPDFAVGNPCDYCVYIFLGGDSFDLYPSITIRINTIGNATFGKTVCGDDWNGDGYSDIAIGQPHWWEGGQYGIINAGKVWIYWGGPTLDTIPDLELVVGDNEQNYGWNFLFGSALGQGGDVNGDGYNDLIVGAPYDDYDAHGRAYIYFGGSEMDSIWDYRFEGSGFGEDFGYAIDIIGDVNQDSYDDFLIGNPQLDGQLAGKAFLFFGGTSISFQNSIQFNSNYGQEYEGFGRYLVGLGDINGDGHIDFGICGEGYANIYFGDSLGQNYSVEEIPAERNIGGISSLSDLNEDGYNDFSLTDYETKIYFGGNSLENFQTDSTLDYWGKPEPLGDINGDGKPEIAAICRRNERYQLAIYSFGEFSGIDSESEQIPSALLLKPTYPNPFNPSTQIVFEVPQTETVSITIYNLRGQLVTRLVNRDYPPGTYSVQWDGRDDTEKSVAAGTYFYKMEAGDFSQTRKMVYLK